MDKPSVRRVTVRVIGFVGVLGGLGLLLVLPVGKATADTFLEFNRIVGRAQWGYIVGSCVFVWGIVTVSDGEWRSLTPQLGFVAPVPALITWTISQYIPLPPEEPPAWTPPETVLHAVRDMFTQGGGVLFAPLLFGIGIAVARKERQWVARGLMMIVVVSLVNTALLRLPGPLLRVGVLGGLIQQWLYSLFYGTPPFILGHLVATPRQHQIEQSNSFPNSQSQPDR